MKSVIRSILCGVALLAVCARGADAQEASATSLLPADTVMVLKFGHLKTLSAKVKDMMASMHASQLMGGSGDPLTMLTTNLGFVKGLNVDGDLVLAMPMSGLTALSGGGPPHVIGLVPVTDYAAFISNFPNPAQENGLDVITSPAVQGKLFSAHWGNYAAMSAFPIMVQNKGAGIVLGELSGKEFASADVDLYINPRPLWTMTRPIIEGLRQTIPDTITADKLPPVFAKYVPVIRVLADGLARGYEQIYTDSTGFGYSVNFQSSGIMITSVADFDPESYMGKIVTSIKGSDKSLLLGLPEGPYILCGGITSMPDVNGPLTAQWLDPIIKAAGTMGGDGKPLVAALTALETTSANLKSLSFALAGPVLENGVRKPGPVIRIDRGNSQSLFPAHKQFVTNLAQIVGADYLNVDFAENSKSIGDVSFSHMTMTFPAAQGLPPPGADATEGQKILDYVLRHGIETDNAAIDKDTVLSLANVTDDRIPAIIASAKSSDDSLSKDPSLAAVSALFPANRTAEIYGRSPDAPNNDPLFAFCSSHQGAGGRNDVYLSATVAQSMVMQAMKLSQQYLGNPAPPANNSPDAAPAPPPPMPGGGL